VRHPERMLARINTLLFDEMGFRGNTDAYYDRRTAFSTRSSIARWAADLAERGLPCDRASARTAIFGVGLPLHFVVKWHDGEREIFIDRSTR